MFSFSLSLTDTHAHTHILYTLIYTVIYPHVHTYDKTHISICFMPHSHTANMHVFMKKPHNHTQHDKHIIPGLVCSHIKAHAHTHAHAYAHAHAHAHTLN